VCDDDEVNQHFSDDELGKNIALYLGKCTSWN